MPYTVKFVPDLTEGCQVVVPISLSNPKFNRESILAIVQTAIEMNVKITILIADYLSRHNMSVEDSLRKGDAIINECSEAFNYPQITVVRWKEWIAAREEQFDLSIKSARTMYAKNENFREGILRTAKQCKSVMSQDSSIEYQLEEYAALLCKQTYDYLLYPAYISHGMLGLYEAYQIKKPVYVHVQLKNLKPKLLSSSTFFSSSVQEKNQVQNKLSRGRAMHASLFTRCLVENIETLLSSPEVSPQDKDWFLEKIRHLTTLYEPSQKRMNF